MKKILFPDGELLDPLPYRGEEEIKALIRNLILCNLSAEDAARVASGSPIVVQVVK